MAVTSVEELKMPRRGTANGQWQRSYTRTYRVQTDSARTGPLEVRLALPVTIGSLYSTGTGPGTEFDNGAFCNEITIECETEDGISWLATIGYGPWDPNAHPQNPLNEIPKISWQTQKFKRPVDVDINGDIVANSAGDPFDPTVEVDDNREILVITRNESQFDESLADQYRDTINSAPFFGFDALCVKCANITGNRVQHADLGYYWEVTYEFEINRDSWVSVVQDQGLRALDPSDDTKIMNITDEEGKDITSPMPLDGAGQPLPIGDPPVGLEFHVLTELDFSDLNLNGFYLYLNDYTPNTTLGGF